MLGITLQMNSQSEVHEILWWVAQNQHFNCCHFLRFCKDCLNVQDQFFVTIYVNGLNIGLLMSVSLLI